MSQPSSSTGAVKRPCSNLKLVYNRPKPDVLNSILKSRANPRYRSRRLWYELNMPECTSAIFDGRMISTSLPDSLLCHTREMRSKNKQKVRKKESKSKFSLWKSLVIDPYPFHRSSHLHRDALGT